MYTDYFKFSKRPFSIIPDPEFLYLSPKHKKALATLKYGLLSRAGFTVVTGGIGSGKTTLILDLLNDYRANCEVGVITNTHSTFGDLLTWVLSAFDITDNTRDKATRFKIFSDYITQQSLKKRPVVLIVDEAQNLDIQTLEELRLLSNINVTGEMMLQLVLVGQPELAVKLNDPQLEQFAQRIAIEYHITALSFGETVNYIAHRLKVAGGITSLFSKSACAAIYYFTGGVPRLINNVSDLALVFAYAEEKMQVDWKIIVEVINERKTGGIKRFQDQLCPASGAAVQSVSGTEQLRHNILNQTGVDILEQKTENPSKIYHIASRLMAKNTVKSRQQQRHYPEDSKSGTN